MGRPPKAHRTCAHGGGEPGCSALLAASLCCCSPWCVLFSLFITVPSSPCHRLRRKNAQRGPLFACSSSRFRCKRALRRCSSNRIYGCTVPWSPAPSRRGSCRAGRGKAQRCQQVSSREERGTATATGWAGGRHASALPVACTDRRPLPLCRTCRSRRERCQTCSRRGTDVVIQLRQQTLRRQQPLCMQSKGSASPPAAQRFHPPANLPHEDCAGWQIAAAAVKYPIPLRIT